MNTFALMQVQVDGSPDEIASISGFDFSQIMDDPQDENIEDLIVLTLLRNYFATISMSHQALPITDMNPNATQMLYGLVLDSSTMEGHTEGSASLVCFNERILKDLLSADLQLGEEARDLPLEEFIELARPHLPPSLEIIQNPITLRIVRATLAPPLPPLMPTALIDSSPSNYIDVFDIIKERLSNREAVVEGSHTVAKYYPDGDYIEFVAECALYFGMEETGNFQIEVHSDDSSNSNANFSIELSGVKEWFSINLGNQKFFDMFTPDLEDIDYSFSLEQDESGDYRAYLAIRNLSGRMLGINIDTDADRVLIESEWTPDEEDSGRGVIVNEIPYGISNMQFRTWNTFLAIPNYLPDTITSLERTFESCKNFDSDISNWDTSRVTSLSHTFDGCKSFMQDISSWDVSNVTNMEYAFNGAYNFNSDLSSWDVGKVESFEYAFNATPYFNHDLSQWDTSSARNMFRMFSSSPRFSSIVEDWDVSNVENMDYMFQSTSGETTSLPPQDLSRWCVTKVPFYPSGFIDYDWAGTLPIWGTCPSESVEFIEDDRFGFNITSASSHRSPDPIRIEMWGAGLDFMVYRNSELILSNELLTHPDMNVIQSVEATTFEVINIREGTDKYAIYTRVKNLAFKHRDSWDTAPIISFDITHIPQSGRLEGLTFEMMTHELHMTAYLPSSISDATGMFNRCKRFNSDLSHWNTSNLTNTSMMFNECNIFNGDISSWDVSKVTNMNSMFSSSPYFNQDISRWDVGNVTDMEFMFASTTGFNQDLSGWCVSNLPTEPSYFSNNTPSWTLPKPLWGTCPTPKDPSDYFYGNFNYPKNPSDPDFKGEPPAPDSPPEGDMRILGYKWESTPYGFGWDNPAVNEVLSTAKSVFNTEEELIQGALDFARDYFEADARYRVENYPASSDYTVDFSTLKIKFNNGLPYPDKDDSEGLRASKSRIRGYVRDDFCNVSGSDVPSVINSFSQYAAITVDVKQNGNISEASGTLNLGVAMWCN